MIIKSMARKDPTFWQLAQYIQREASGQAFTHNLLQSGADLSDVADDFAQNYAHLPKRRRGNSLYHEIIALEQQPHLSPAKQIDVLNQLAARYCQLRAPDQMAWGMVHLDTDYPHLHLMISANDKSSNKRVRLSKVQFAEIQRDVEGFARAQFPQIAGRAVYAAKPRGNVRIKSSEGELERRTKSPSTKRKVADQLRDLLTNCPDASQLNQTLNAAGFTLVKRGQSHVIATMDGTRRYRVKTLGLTDQLDTALARVPPPIAPQSRAQALLDQRRALDQRMEQHLRDFPGSDRDQDEYER